MPSAFFADKSVYDLYSGISSLAKATIFFNPLSGKLPALNSANTSGNLFSISIRKCSSNSFTLLTATFLIIFFFDSLFSQIDNQMIDAHSRTLSGRVLGDMCSCLTCYQFVIQWAPAMNLIFLCAAIYCTQILVWNCSYTNLKLSEWTVITD